MPMSPGRYIALETAISIVANTTLVTIVGILIFGHKPQVAIWGVGNVAFDLLLQTSTVAFFSSLVASLLTRWRLRRGVLESGSIPLVRLPTGVFLQSLAVALIAIVLLLPGTIAVIALCSISALALVPFMALKIALTIAAAVIATQIALTTVLAKA
jgi:hypothetical protein